MQQPVTEEMFNERLAQWDSVLWFLCRQICPASLYEDAMAVARQELWLAMVKFDPQKASFATYCTGRVRGGLRHLVGAERRYHRREQAWDGETEDPWVADPAPQMMAAVDASDLMTELTELERALVWGCYAEQKSVRAVAREQGQSHARLYAIKDRAIQRLRRNHPGMIIT